MRTTILSLALAFTAAASAQASDTRYVYLVNDSLNSATSIRAIAEDGTITNFNKDVPLRGNETAHIELSASNNGERSCLYTIEAEFRRGEPLRVEDFNVCTTKTLHLGKALRYGRLQG